MDWKYYNITSIRKPNIIVFDMQSIKSSLYTPLRFSNSWCSLARRVSSRMNNSQALAKVSGAFALNLVSSSSNCMIFFIRKRELVYFELLFRNGV
jgi:hypothetical protein